MYFQEGRLQTSHFSPVQSRTQRYRSSRPRHNYLRDYDRYSSRSSSSNKSFEKGRHFHLHDRYRDSSVERSRNAYSALRYHPGEQELQPSYLDRSERKRPHDTDFKYLHNGYYSTSPSLRLAPQRPFTHKFGTSQAVKPKDLYNDYFQPKLTQTSSAR
jgi:hypothetical protein